MASGTACTPRPRCCAAASRSSPSSASSSPTCGSASSSCSSAARRVRPGSDRPAVERGYVADRAARRRSWRCSSSRRVLPVLADAHLPGHGRAGRGAQRHPVPHAPQGAARPHPGRRHRPAVPRAAVRRREARSQRRRQDATCSSRTSAPRAPTTCARDILRLASGIAAAGAGGAAAVRGAARAPSLGRAAGRRAVAPELDPDWPRRSRSCTCPGRLIGSTRAQRHPIFFVVAVIAGIIGPPSRREFHFLFGVVPLRSASARTS